MQFRACLFVVVCCAVATEGADAAARRGASRGQPNAAMMQRFQQMQNQRRQASAARRPHQNAMSKLANQREREAREARERKHDASAATSSGSAKDNKAHVSASPAGTGSLSKETKSGESKPTQVDKNPA